MDPGEIESIFARLQKAREQESYRTGERPFSALFDLGMRYLEGRGLPKNVELGKRMIKDAADAGYADAVAKLKTLE